MPGSARFGMHSLPTREQVIDDTRSITLAAASTLTPDVKQAVEGNGGTVVRAPLPTGPLGATSLGRD
jgi:ribosomal protein L18